MVQIHYRDLRIIGDDGTQHMRRSLGNMDLMMEIWKSRWSRKDDLGNISLDNDTNLLSPSHDRRPDELSSEVALQTKEG